MSVSTFDPKLAKQMMDAAIGYSTEKSGHRSTEQTLSAIRTGDCLVCDYLRHGLAQRVAEYLGSVDGTVRALYVYEPEYSTPVDGSGPPRPSLSPGINMIAWVSRKSAALSSLVGLVSSSLAEEFRRMSCPRANPACFMLQVQIVDDEEVSRRQGYGALIESLYVRPIEVWRR